VYKWLHLITHQGYRINVLYRTVGQRIITHRTIELTTDKWTSAMGRGPIWPISPIVQFIIKCNSCWSATALPASTDLMLYNSPDYAVDGSLVIKISATKFTQLINTQKKLSVYSLRKVNQ